MWTAGFPEPRTFSLRAARLLRTRTADFDVVHDNQCLGYGLLDIAGQLPVVATIHHPITRDRALDLAAAPLRRKPFVHRWYGFLGMQRKVARQIPDLITVSSASAADIVDDFGVVPDRLRVVPLGVDTELIRPRDTRVPGRIVAVASADKPLKGIGHLLQAVSRLRLTHDVELQLLAKLDADGPTRAIRRRAYLPSTSTGWASVPAPASSTWARAWDGTVFESYRRGAHIIAFDQNADDLAQVKVMFGAMAETGEAPADATAEAVQGDALAMPYEDGEFDVVIASEILEHIPGDARAIAELVRVTAPGGALVVTVPRWLPERICWLLSDEYHANEGGHVRIYRADALRGTISRHGMRFVHSAHGHALHAPYWWLKCLVGVSQDHWAVTAYHRMLVWDMMKGPRLTRSAESALDPLTGKSVALYFTKPAVRRAGD